MLCWSTLSLILWQPKKKCIVWEKYYIRRQLIAYFKFRKAFWALQNSRHYHNDKWWWHLSWQNHIFFFWKLSEGIHIMMNWIFYLSDRLATRCMWATCQHKFLSTMFVHLNILPRNMWKHKKYWLIVDRIFNWVY